MKRLITATLSLLFCLTTTAQLKIRQSDWQQRVDYTIDVKLNDVDHMLDGNATYVYTNNSPNELRSIYFHLWPNGYKNRNTAFARQQLGNGSTKFHFSDADEKGYIDSLSFNVDGKAVKWTYANGMIDACELQLTTPVKSGESVTISTPFRVKIPGSFSRFGHEGQGYQMTQWYPKPVVYDVNGWNTIPYLDQGEFYSEFGKFEVRITVPDNYIVAATGELQEESEKEFIQDRVDEPVNPKSDIVSSSTYKTITYIQDNIHDFAWFADKNFNVKKDAVTLKNGQVVETFVYAASNRLDYTKHIETALQYYSDHCGPYPYSHCSIVKGALKAGGGMEYPMITVLAIMNEEVIVHEVGHNWFYGILGNDERNYPWMDESINSYFEHEAMHHEDKKPKPTLEKTRFSPSGINDLAMDIGAKQLETMEMHQAIGAHSAHLTNANYGLMVYGKGSAAFAYLKSYLGQRMLDKCFQTYFNRWKYKHPLPGDIKDVFEEVSGKNLDWFFQGLINTEKHLDYAVTEIAGTQVTVLNKGGIPGPYPIGLFKEGVFVKQIWVEGHQGANEVDLSGADFDVVKIDPYEVLPEYRRQNNTIRTSGAFKRVEPLKLQFMSVLDDPNRTTLNVTPLIAWNTHNKFMVGLWFNNFELPTKRLSFSAAPLFSPRTNDINGYANVNYSFYRNASFNFLNVGMKAARFGIGDGEFSYEKLRPFVRFNFREGHKRGQRNRSLTLQATQISISPNFDQETMIASLANDSGRALGRRQIMVQAPNQFADLIYLSKNTKALNPSSLKVQLQVGIPQTNFHRYDTTSMMVVEEERSDLFAKLNVEWKKHINYDMPKKGLDIRAFGGVFIDPSDDGAFHYRMESAAGRWDYTYDQILMGRAATEGLFSRQVTQTDVFLKEPGTFANMDNWVLGLNLVSDLPLKLPLSVYFDVFTFADIDQTPNVKEGEAFIYNGGLQVNVIRDFLEVYLPLFSSNMIQEAQALQGIDNLGQRITFKLNLNLFEEKGFNDLMKLGR